MYTELFKIRFISEMPREFRAVTTVVNHIIFSIRTCVFRPNLRFRLLTSRLCSRSWDTNTLGREARRLEGAPPLSAMQRFCTERMSTPRISRALCRPADPRQLPRPCCRDDEAVLSPRQYQTSPHNRQRVRSKKGVTLCTGDTVTERPLS